MPVQAFSNHQITFTLQFVALPRLDDLRKPTDIHTELESLMYCFLFAVTKDSLHWKHCDAIPDAYNAKAAAMCVPAIFNAKVVARIIEPELKDVAQRLQQLFFANSGQVLDVQAFQACFS